jgi:farnesyl-diphosphate farnesyltransferase
VFPKHLAMAPTPNDLLTDLLKQVSRSFYLTLRVLPAKIRPQISLAYLLARTTDTIADTELVSLEQRLAALEALRRRILDGLGQPLDFGPMAQHQGAPAERILLERCEESLNLLALLTAGDRQLVRDVLQTIISGQELDLRRFAAASSGNIVALASDQELDNYTYRVAGCVGEFWTKMCRAHLFAKASLDDAFLLANGTRFGKGLQLVNILRDLPADLGQGRCYLPLPALDQIGLKPEDLLNPANEPKLRPLYNIWLDRAEGHLHAGWAYTNALPRGSVRVRLACAWPILIGLESIRLLRSANVLNARQRIKITRPQVKKIMLRSLVCYPFPAAWQGLAEKLP